MDAKRILFALLITITVILAIAAIVSTYRKLDGIPAGLTAEQDRDVRIIIQQEMRVQKFKDASAAAALLTPTVTPTPTKRLVSPFQSRTVPSPTTVQ